MPRTELLLIYSTFPTKRSAEVVSNAALEKRMAACVHIGPSMDSRYLWKGKMLRSKEIPVLFKTSLAKKAKLCALMRSLHPYECPCVAEISTKSVNEDYLSWIAESVG